ncbi:uncharacterized protein LOC125239800 [Leguminivora glycinivorella]|uniref:uncharacterized protein LOC125239800 n=1 Tax=Leguminivora glycinivorella TaxID=1035111 RepID=UPI00200F7E84|nr:uncharacterized protein LOC125239800 [Leguminivora glycinivorella]
MAKVKNRYPCLRKRKRRNEIAVQKAREALAARRKELSKLLNNDASTSGTNMEKIGTFDKEVNKENTYFDTGKNDGFVESNDDFTIQVEGSPASCDENKEANKENIYCQIGRNDASVATDEVLTIQFEGSPASCDENEKLNNENAFCETGINIASDESNDAYTIQVENSASCDENKVTCYFFTTLKLISNI